jgi:hypothetical protein
MIQNQLFVKEQYGFRNKLSTEEASYTLTNEILEVNHEIFLNKLEHYVIVGRFNALIKSYLTERYQRVLIQNNSKSSYSDWKMIKQYPKDLFLVLYFFYYT